MLLPIVCSAGAGIAFGLGVGEPHGTERFLWWWPTMIAISAFAFAVGEWLARRAVPLKLLLSMDVVFPGVAPHRLSVARRAASTRGLARRVEEARTTGITDEPTVAAEKIVTLAMALSAHDRLTRGHAERVRAIADMIADEMRLDEDSKDRLRWSSLLHDIGKLTVHPHILNKAGKPTDEEWETLRRHPLEGARITRPLADWLGEWSQTIAEHHERYDGAGYPHGLTGSEISLGGRIVAVADVFDVMTAGRSYQRPVSALEARRELVACAGAQFDPEVVRAFVSVPLRRLRGAVPLGWLGSRAGDWGGRLMPLVDAGGRTALSGLAALGLVVGVGATSHRSTADRPVRTQVASSQPADASTMAPGPGTGGAGARTETPPSSPRRFGTTDKANRPKSSDRSTPAPSRAVAEVSGSTTSLVSPVEGVSRPTPGAEPGPGGGSAASEPTGPAGYPTGPSAPDRSASGPDPTTAPSSPATAAPPVTTAPTAPTTVPKAPPPTTSTTAIALSPPTNLTATGRCVLLLVLVPEVNLAWTPSPTPSVTSYAILRSTGGAYSQVATVAGRASGSYSDTSVSGGSTYSYKVEAVSPTGTAVSVSASGTTPALCLG